LPNRAATLSSWERAAEAPNRVAPKLTLHDGSERSIEFLMIHSAAGEGFINDIIYPHQNLCAWSLEADR